MNDTPSTPVKTPQTITILSLDTAVQNLPAAEVNYGITQEALTEIESRLAIIPDCSTKDGLKQCKKEKRELVSLRVKVDTRRKNVKRSFEVSAQDIIERITNLEIKRKDEIFKAEEAERKEKEKAAHLKQQLLDQMNAAIDEIEDLGKIKFQATSEDIKLNLSAANSIVIEDDFFDGHPELKLKAESILITVKSILENGLSQALEAEEQKIKDDKIAADLEIEKEKLRVEKEKLQKERDDLQDKIKKSEREQRQKEQDAKDEDARILKIETDKINAENKKIQDEKDAKEQAVIDAQIEADRKADEEQKKRDEEFKIQQSRKAKKDNARRISNEIFEIISTCESKTASNMLAVKLIKNEITHMRYMG